MRAVSAPGKSPPGGNIGLKTGGKLSAPACTPSLLDPPTTDALLAASRLELSAWDLAARSANLAKGSIRELRYSDSPTRDGVRPGSPGIWCPAETGVKADSRGGLASSGRRPIGGILVEDTTVVGWSDGSRLSGDAGDGEDLELGSSIFTLDMVCYLVLVEIKVILGGVLRRKFSPTICRMLANLYRSVLSSL